MFGNNNARDIRLRDARAHFVIQCAECFGGPRLPRPTPQLTGPHGPHPHSALPYVTGIHTPDLVSHQTLFR